MLSIRRLIAEAIPSHLDVWIRCRTSIILGVHVEVS